VESGRSCTFFSSSSLSLGESGFWETGDRRSKRYLHTLLVGETGFYVLPVFSLLAGGLVLKAALIGQETYTASAFLVCSLK